MNKIFKMRTTDMQGYWIGVPVVLGEHLTLQSRSKCFEGCNGESKPVIRPRIKTKPVPKTTKLPE